MEFLQYYNKTKFLAYVPKIREDRASWQFVEVVLTGKTRHNAAYIAKKLKEYFLAYEGIIFICSAKEILVLAKTGREIGAAELASAVNDKMPKYSCTAAATAITEEGLQKLQFRMEDVDEAAKSKAACSELFTTRKDRAEKIALVADDDLFMRSLIVKALKGKAQVIEIADAAEVVERYLEILPDIVFLDIHLPGASGIDIMSEMINFDDSAYVIIMSSDSIKNNVLEAKRIGAKGFLAKPFTPEKLEACYTKCPSVTATVAPAKSGS